PWTAYLHLGSRGGGAMAFIFRPPYTRTDPATGGKVQGKVGRFYVEYTDASGERRRVPGFPEKDATLQLAAKLEREAALEASGLVDPLAAQRRRPLKEHLDDYERFLASKGSTPKHVLQTRRRIDACLGGGGFRLAGGLDRNPVDARTPE